MLATYEKRLTKTPTRIAFLVAIAAIATVLITTLVLDPLTVWSEDHARPISAMAIADNWSTAYTTFLEHFDGFDNPVMTASGRFVSILVAAIQTLWRDDVLAALRRALIYAMAAGGPTTIICYSIALSGEDIVDTREHKEGMRLLRGKKGIAHLRKVMAKESNNADPGLRLAPRFAISKLREIRGTMIAGAIGSGKTRILLYILEGILGILKNSPERRVRLLIHDTTGELLQGLPLPNQAFAALHGARPGGWGWAQGRDVLTKSDAEAVGDAMAPNTDESIWGSGAAVFLAAAQVKCQVELGTAWGVPEFYDNLLEDPVKLKAIYEKIYPIAAALIEIDPSTGALSKTTVSFLLTFRAAVLRYLRPLAENWRAIPAERRFSFIEWLEDSNPSQPPVVLLQRSGKYAALSAAWIGAIVDTIAGHVNDEAFPNSQQRRVYLVLEELATLRKLKNLSTLLDTGRNKGIGVIVSVQEIEQLQIHYGELEASTILKRFRTKIICQQVLDGDTDEFSKSYVGKRVVIDPTESQSTTTDKNGTSTTTAKNNHEKEVPSIRGERLAHDLGVFGNRVKAIVAGIEDPVELEWPVTIWAPRRR
jgi:type IV secretion system coupling TraD/TrwB family protein